MINRKEYSLGELIEKGLADLQTGPFGTMLNASEYSDSGVPVIAVKDIGENRLIHSNFVYIPEDVAERLNAYRVKKHDIIFGRKGAVDRRALIKGTEEGWIQGSDCIRLRLKHPVDPVFVSYQLGSNRLKTWLVQNATGATMPSLNQRVLKLLPVVVPSVSEQKAITAVLASLDDKIDLLHRQNKTLEALAQTLFRHWFDEEAGDDWNECSLYDAIDLVGGGTPRTKEESYWNGDICWLSGGDIASNHKNFVVTSERKITQLGLENSSAKLLPQNATVISARGTVGKYCLLAEPMAFSQSNYGIKPKFADCFFFTYLLIDYSVTALQSASYGSVFDTITTRTFKNHNVYIPPVTGIQAFEKQITPYFERMLLNQKQIQTLERLRDTLLPKLMSGEVRVRQS